MFIALVGFESHTHDGSTAAELLQWLSTEPAMAASCGAAQRHLVAARGQARQLLAVWLTRERAIMTHVQATRARLAPRQPGLFGRRLVCSDEAQAAVLEEVVTRCEERVRDLGRQQPSGIGDCNLAFAALL